MSPFVIATLLGYIKPDTGTLSDTMNAAAQKAANWLGLPRVQSILTMPIVPDGSVQGQRYIPPNTTVDVVANSGDLAASAKKLLIVGSAGGAIVGIVLGRTLLRKH
jgi:hypothetical protein